MGNLLGEGKQRLGWFVGELLRILPRFGKASGNPKRSTDSRGVHGRRGVVYLAEEPIFGCRRLYDFSLLDSLNADSRQRCYI